MVVRNRTAAQREIFSFDAGERNNVQALLPWVASSAGGSGGVGPLGRLCAGAEPSSEAARLDLFSKPNGANYFALSFSPGKKLPLDAGLRQVVVVFDTSASQMGEFRGEARARSARCWRACGRKIACDCWPPIWTRCR